MKIYELISSFFSTPTSMLNAIQGIKDSLKAEPIQTYAHEKEPTHAAKGRET